MTAIELARILEYGNDFKLYNTPKTIKPVQKNTKENTETINVEKELYGIYDGYQYLAFETENDRDEYCNNYKGSYIKKISLGYIGSYMQKDNIIKLTSLEDSKETRFLSVVNRELSYCYDENTGKWSTCRTDLGNLPSKIKEIKQKVLETKAI